MDPGPLLAQARRNAGLTQRELARRAGTAVSVVGDVENGRWSPTVRQLCRLLAAAGYQLTADIEPLGEDIERLVRRALSMPVPERIAELGFPFDLFMRFLDDVPYVIEGLAAALLQGAPVPATVVDLAVLDDSETLARLGRAIARSSMVRFWAEDRNRWVLLGSVIPAHFRELGPVTRWQIYDREARIRLARPDEITPALHVEVDGIPLPVAGLWQVETTDERVAAILARTRELSRAVSAARTA